MLPSMSSAVSQSPSPGTRSYTERHSARPPDRRVWSTAAALMSMPSTGRHRPRSAVTNLPGPQPMSMTAPRQRRTTSWSAAVAAPHHRSMSNGKVRPSARRRNNVPPPARNAFAYRSDRQVNAGGSGPVSSSARNKGSDPVGFGGERPVPGLRGHHGDVGRRVDVPQRRQVPYPQSRADQPVPLHRSGVVP